MLVKDLQRVWQLFTYEERRKAVWMLLLVVLMAGVETLGVLSIMPFLSVIGRPEVINENSWLKSTYAAFGFRNTHQFTVALGIASIMVVVIASLFKVLTQHAINRFIHLQRHSISTRLLQRYLQQPYGFFLGRNTSALNKNILSETDQILFNLIQPLAQMIAQSVVVAAMACVIILYDPIMALVIMIVVAAMYALIYGVARRRLSHIGSERLIANRNRFQASTELFDGIKSVKVAGAADAYTARFRDASRQYSRHMATNDTVSQTPLYLVEAVGYSGLILIALILLLRNDGMANVLPALGLYGFAGYRMLPAAQIIYRGLAKLKFASPALGEIQGDLALPEEQRQTQPEVSPPKHSIRLERVRFAYPSNPTTTLFNQFDLTIPANSSVGIAGRSGSGKSTLMDLLLGLLHPDFGDLLVDGRKIDNSNSSSWQQHIGYVPQQVFIADATVAENIALGTPRESIDMGAVTAAANLAQIHGFVATELDDSYNTILGEKGSRLSGGQRQRIGIARALYRDPPVIFFDEATSALDDQTESALTHAMKSLKGRKTIVIISHDAETLQFCDQIISLDGR